MSNSIVSDAVGEEVIFSTTCFENAQLEGSYTYLEIAKTTQPSDGIPTDCVKGVTKIITGSLTVGMVLLPPPVDIACGVLAAFGGLVSLGLDLFFEKEDPVAKELEQLAEKMKQLDDQIMARFDDMKSFITENKFSVEIIGEVATLKKFMNDVIKMSDENSKENFRAAYEQNPPLNIAYILASLLSQKATNPLSMAVEADKSNSFKTLDAWENIIKTIIGDLLFIESFAAGLLKKEDLFDAKRICEQKEETDAMLKELDEKYRVAPWRDFKKSFPDYLKNHTHLTNEEKALEIRTILEKTIPQYGFFVCVFNRAPYKNKFYLYYDNNPDNIVFLQDVGFCHAFVYRSTKFREIDQSEYKSLADKVYFFKNWPYFDGDEVAYDMVRNYILGSKSFRTDGLIAVMDKNVPKGFQIANCQGYENGPGTKQMMRWPGYLPYELIFGFP
ncbi:hypothetical protein CAEBREN_31923 [Caenorhabditis brenneri]|uniref:Uncharacterized protein n=1 Tax=Caenorhabditis brenneri TaxID=135651 RepID=G0P421_CAEBE|nr:hypothetical protein CAEBREN_31923 [Caenorhabditis brenneri]